MILRYWQPIGAAVVAMLISYGLHHIFMILADNRREAALSEQHDLLTKSCNDDKQKAKEANDALQQTAADISSKLATYKRLHPSSCILPGTGKAEPSAGGAGHAGGDGIDTGTLRDFAAQCETYRQQRIILEQAQ